MPTDRKCVYDQFKEMEKRYHTWMNYYSLFNGALLVAYCTILVSTGQVIEMGGEFFNNDITGNAKLFQLECTYWNILALIAFLGCIASYCWYLSAIGHYHWIDRWREALIKTSNYPKLDFSEVDIWPCCNKAIHYHSTFKVTFGFIVAVLTAWITVAYCSIFDHGFNIGWDKLFVILIVLGLIAFEFIIHFITGSDLSHYNKVVKKKGIICIIYEGVFKNLGWTIVILLFVTTLIYAIYNCPTTGIEKKKEFINNEKSEILFKIEVLNSDSLIFNDSVATTIKH